MSREHYLTIMSGCHDGLLYTFSQAKKLHVELYKIVIVELIFGGGLAARAAFMAR